MHRTSAAVVYTLSRISAPGACLAPVVDTAEYTLRCGDPCLFRCLFSMTSIISRFPSQFLVILWQWARGKATNERV